MRNRKRERLVKLSTSGFAHIDNVVVWVYNRGKIEIKLKNWSRLRNLCLENRRQFLRGVVFCSFSRVNIFCQSLKKGGNGNETKETG